MEPNYATNVSWQLLAAFSGRQVSTGTLTVHLDDAVTEIEIARWVFVRKLAAEKFRKSLHFDFMDLIKLEPATTAGDNHRPARILF